MIKSHLTWILQDKKSKMTHTKLIKHHNKPNQEALVNDNKTIW
jgi:hypothetical protein